MLSKRALLISTALHLSLLAIFAASWQFSWPDSKILPAIEARLIFKAKARDKELLPKKPQAAAPAHEELKLAPSYKPKKLANQDKYRQELASLSKMFSQELNSTKPPEAVAEASADHSYFDQIYSLIKESFIVPPHVNGPAGYHLQAVLRLFLLADGSLFQVKLESSSGDEHFDKAVLEGTKRVNNFGSVPVLLQGVLRERGLVVELCPFKCAGP